MRTLPRAFLDVYRLLGLLLIVLSLSACQSARQPSQSSPAAAIEDVYRRQTDLVDQVEVALNQGLPMMDVLGAFIDRMHEIDVSNCPPDFREAFTRSVNAWEDYYRHFKNGPQNLLEFGASRLLSYLDGHKDAGLNEIVRRRDALMEAIAATQEEVEAIGARHGARRFRKQAEPTRSTR